MKALLLVLGVVCKSAFAYDGTWASEQLKVLGYDVSSGKIYVQKNISIEPLRGEDEGAVRDSLVYEFDKNGKEKVYCINCKPNVHDFAKKEGVLANLSPLPKNPPKIPENLKKKIAQLKFVSSSNESPNKKCRMDSQIYLVGSGAVANYEVTHALKTTDSSIQVLIGRTAKMAACKDAMPKFVYYWFPHAPAVFAIEHDRKEWVPGSGCSWHSERMAFSFLDEKFHGDGDYDACFK